jgi:hypothetical protein
MKRLLTVILIIIWGTNGVIAQKTYLLPLVVVGNDTMPCVVLKNFIVIGHRPGTSKQELNRYSKLVRNIIKVYPYAKMAAQKLQEYDNLLAKIPDTKEQKRIMKIAEKDIRKDFQKEIEDLTFSQGIILLKLVDRETSKTTYQIVDELRGSLRAFFYQAIAKLFKYDLKDKYDPKGRDKEIEKIILQIEDVGL